MESLPPPAILLVEDHTTLLKVFQRVLEDSGYLVTPCADGLDALRLIEHEQSTIDLLLSDVGLPGMRGDRLAAELRRLRPAVPALLMTGHSEAVSPANAASLGAVALLQKPITVEDLLAAVRDALASATPARR